MKQKGSLRIVPKEPARHKPASGKGNGRKSGRTSGKTRRSTRSKRKSKSLWPRVITVGLLVLLAGLAYYLYSGQSGVRGIDVSHHQGNIDWEVVGEADDLKFAFIKATEGERMHDKLFTQNLHGARNARLKVGAYHFFLPGVDGKTQFENFRKVVGKDIDLKPVLDLEETKAKIDDDAYRHEVSAYIENCEKYYGCKPIVYASPSFVKDHGLKETLQNCPYWIAWYSRALRFIASRRRFLLMAYPGTQAIMWQYTDRGHHPGIVGDVDLDECWEMASICL